MKKLLNFRLCRFYSFLSVSFLVCFCFKKLVWVISNSHTIFYNKFFDFSYLKNTGAAFSVLKESNYFLGIFALIVSASIIFYVHKNYTKLKNLDIYAYAVLLAGILSNMCERFFDGFVTDYIKLSFIEFPVFNLADVFINVGAVILIVSILFEKRGLNGKSD